MKYREEDVKRLVLACKALSEAASTINAAEKRQAFDAWASHVMGVVSDESADVIEFHRA